MSFPFIAPLKSWIKEKLEKRETTGFNKHKLSPFIILTSGAVVTNQNPSDSKELAKIIKGGDYGDGAYRGCVISNQSSIKNLYQSSDTILGYDLNKKPITIKGERDRKISTPIIESLEIDTDGGNNTLKEAKVKIKVFSLKQLEMFDLFFLRPSMSVMLEYGWNTDIIANNNKINSVLKSNQNYNSFKYFFVKFFDNTKSSKDEYLTTLKETDGNYDYMVGKVTDFTFAPVEDGTYDVDLTVSSGNELQLWMPIKQSKDKSGVNKKDKANERPYIKWLKKIQYDFNLPEAINFPEKDWVNEFFNFDMLNSQEKDKVVSYEPYISFKFILQLLQLGQKLQLAEEKLPIYFYEDVNKKIPVILMNSNKYMISTSEDLIIPNKMPKFKFSPDKGKENQLIVDTTGGDTECYVNDKVFNLNQKQIYNRNGESIKLDDNKQYGNLLNIFINYNAVLRAYNSAYTQADFINQILQIVNDNTFGLCKLEIMKPEDTSDTTLTIMDYKLQSKIPSDGEKKSDTYRFKIGPSGSILKEFSFNMELSTLAQAQSLYQSQLNLSSIMGSEQFASGSNATLKDDAYSLFDLSYAKNSDGYFSINEIEKNIVINAAKKTKERQEKDKIAPAPKTGEKESDKEVQNLEEVLKSKSIKFKSIKNKKSETKTYIFLDTGLIKNLVIPDKKGSALTFLEISLAIDGMAGFSCGEYFQIDGIPEIYNRTGFFQITNVKQGIDDNGWKTTIEAGFRIDIEKAEGK